MSPLDYIVLYYERGIKVKRRPSKNDRHHSAAMGLLFDRRGNTRAQRARQWACAHAADGMACMAALQVHHGLRNVSRRLCQVSIKFVKIKWGW